MTNSQEENWVTTFKKALVKIESELNEGQRKILLGHYHAPDMALSVQRFAEIAGYQGVRAGSLQYGKFARKISALIGEPTQGDQISTIAQWRGDLKDSRGHGQWVLFEEVAQALEELGWVGNQRERSLSDEEESAFLLTWKEGNPPHRFIDFKHHETWRCFSHKQAKVGDLVYLMKQGKPPRGIFGRGQITSSPYQIQNPGSKPQWVVDIQIDEIADPISSMFITEAELLQLHRGEGLWHTMFSGVKIPQEVTEAIENSRQWKFAATTLNRLPTQSIPDIHTKKSEIEVRIGQQQFRENLLQYWRSCSVTGCSFQEALIASHIVPWATASDSERLDVSNGLLLTPNLDKLFDKYLISFNSRGEILISKSLSSKTKSDFGINPSMQLRRTDEKLLSYLKKHEKAFLEKEQER